MHCPICHTEFDPNQSAALPFCSERCRTIDLGRWLSESYQMPVIRDPETDAEADDATLADRQGTPPVS